MKLLSKKILLWVGLFFLCSVFFAFSTNHFGFDFHVYYQSAQLFFQNLSPYTQKSAFMIYKYPPWTCFVFFPFGLLSFSMAKILWGIVQAVSFLWILLWLRKNKTSWKSLGTSFVFFYWIFLDHARSGQVSLPLCALLLFAFKKRHENASFFFTTTLWALSWKGFSLLALFGVSKKYFTQKSITLSLLFFLLCSLPLFTLSFQKSHTFFFWIKPFQSWIQNAQGGGSTRAGFAYRRHNQGLPALFFKRHLPKHFISVLVLSGLCFLILALLWSAFSKNLSSPLKWTGWLTLVTLVHPLAWFHNFVFAFPFCALILEQAFLKKRSFFLYTWLFSSLILFGWVTTYSAGFMGRFLEANSIKSLSLISLAAFIVVIFKHSENKDFKKNVYKKDQIFKTFQDR